jgi:hypothetical protein
MQSVLNCHVSYYPNRFATGGGVTTNLLLLLHSQKHKQIITQLRNQPDAQKQQAIKEQLPCFTVAGIFTVRNNTGLKHPSGLACVDLDAAEDYNALHLLNQLKKISCIAYAGLSCRGKRLYLIVPFATPQYQKHYERLIQSFTDMGLPMGDSCHKAISQPRNVSYNTPDTHWFNHYAQPYALLPVERTYHYPAAIHGATPNFKYCEERTAQKHHFTAGQRHQYLVALAGYCKFRGLSQQDTLTGCLAYTGNGVTAYEIKKVVEWAYK